MEDVKQENTTPQRVRPATIRHREIISRLVYHAQTPAEIAQELGFSRSGLDQIIRSPLFQAELQKEMAIKQRIERDAVIQRVASKGVKKLEEILDTGKMVFVDGERKMEKVVDGREIVAIIQDALDRTGHKPVNVSVEATADLGSMIIKAHKEKEDGAPDVIDIEAIEAKEN